MKKLLIILMLVPAVSFGQSYSNVSRNEITFKEDTKKNKISLGWEYYGRGNGFSFVYDREFSSFFSAGIGLEDYFIEDENRNILFFNHRFSFFKTFKNT